MGLNELLSKLHGVKAGNAVGRYIARCPAHEDRAPSLTIRGEEDGRILIHCFAGCDALDVVQAVGMTLSDLFPERLTRERMPRVHMPFSPMDALNCLTTESAIVAIAASDLSLGKTLSEPDTMRVLRAAGRIATALEVLHG